jgi:chromosome partitioning protein
VANLKGGSGKSLVAFNLGVWLTGCGARVRLIDLDPQKTLTDLVAVRREQNVRPSLDAPLDVIGAVDDTEDGVWTLVDVGAADVPRMRQAISQADIVLVPVVPGQPDIWATQRFLQMIQGDRKAAAHVRLIVNRADPLGVARETREAIVALKVMAAMLHGVTVLPTHLAPRVAFSRSLSEGLAVFELEPRSKASDEFQALAQASIPPP